MKTPDQYVVRIAPIAALLICATFIGYFMLMKYFNFIHVIELRFLNMLILIVGLVITFRYYRVKTKILNIPYFDGLLLGLGTSFISFALFALFVYIYFSRIDILFLQQLKDNTLLMGSSLTATSAAGTVMIEGVCSGGIISFIIMQYYKFGFYRTIQEKREDEVPV